MTIPVYCMPGLGASARIFEWLKLPAPFQIYLLEWEEPFSKETLQEYAQRMARKITEPNPVLIGVSLGGILVQEIAKILPQYRKIILISSIKSERELPLWMRFSKKLRLHYLLPLHWIASLQLWKHTKRYKRLYYKYIGLTSPKYLTWSVRRLLEWKATPLERLIHIQGDKDIIFPVRNIKGCIIVKGGTHIMIVSRFRWFNEHLPSLLT